MVGRQRAIFSPGFSTSFLFIAPIIYPRRLGFALYLPKSLRCIFVFFAFVANMPKHLTLSDYRVPFFFGFFLTLICHFNY